MRPPGDATCLAATGSKRALEELDQEPDSKEYGGRDHNELQEEENRHQRNDIGVRIQKQVGAHHGRHGTTGANRGHD